MNAAAAATAAAAAAAVSAPGPGAARANSLCRRPRRPLSTVIISATEGAKAANQAQIGSSAVVMVKHHCGTGLV